MVSLEFFIDIKSFRPHGPGVDSASIRNEYQEHFLGGKGGRCVRLTTLPPSCAVVMKSGNLNFLEPFGHSRPVTGLLYIIIIIINATLWCLRRRLFIWFFAEGTYLSTALFLLKEGKQTDISKLAS